MCPQGCGYAELVWNKICVHGRRYAEFVGNVIWPQWLHCDDRFAFATYKRKYTSVGRQCAHKDVGMPNLSGTKFGRNGFKCYDRFALPAWMQVCRICREQNSAAMASNVKVALCCLHGRSYAKFVGNEIWPQPTP